MKVLHVSNYFRGTHSHIGGAEQACFRTAKMLAENGHEVAVVTKKFDNASHGNGNASFRIHDIKVYEDYVAEPLKRYIEAVKWYSLQYDFFARRKFRAILLQEEPDIVHFHNFQFLTFSLLREAFKQGIPTCLSIYDYWIFCPKAMLLMPDNTFCREAHGIRCLKCLPPQFSLLQRLLLAMRKRVFDNCFEMIDAFIVLSGHSAGILRNYGIRDSKIKVVPLTLPLEYDDEGIDMPVPDLAENSILFAGWLNDRKGVHIAIEAMRYIRNELPDARLYIIGGRAKFADEYERSYNRTIERYNLHDHLVFLGHQPPEVVKEYLKRSSVLIIPEQYENMSPLIMIEAMMLGTPVVASNLGGIPEYIRDGKTGLLADPYNPEDFAVQIVKILKNPELASSIGASAREFIIKNNSNDMIWRKTLSVYEELIATDRQRALIYG